MRHLRYILYLSLAGSLFLGPGACSSPSPEDKGERTEEAQAPVVEAVEEESADMAFGREAFGLPFPPEVMRVRRETAYVRVSTRMSLEDLEAFFASRLVDYELLRPTRLQFRAVGLRQYMPEIFAFKFSGPRSHTVIEYRAAPEIPVAVREAVGKDGDDLAPKVDRVERQREKGMPVLERTRSGELLAPGARWGEPYTPPEGTPLHSERNRSNYGLPFGEWILP